MSIFTNFGNISAPPFRKGTVVIISANVEPDSADVLLLGYDDKVDDYFVASVRDVSNGIASVTRKLANVIHMEQAGIDALEQCRIVDKRAILEASDGVVDEDSFAKANYDVKGESDTKEPLPYTYGHSGFRFKSPKNGVVERIQVLSAPPWTVDEPYKIRIHFTDGTSEVVDAFDNNRSYRDTDAVSTADLEKKINDLDNAVADALEVIRQNVRLIDDKIDGIDRSISHRIDNIVDNIYGPRFLDIEGKIEEAYERLHRSAENHMKLFDALEEKDKELEKKIAELEIAARSNHVETAVVPNLVEHNEKLFRAIAADIHTYFNSDAFARSSSMQDEDRIVSIVRKHLFR